MTKSTSFITRDIDKSNFEKGTQTKIIQYFRNKNIINLKENTIEVLKQTPKRLKTLTSDMYYS